DINVINFVDDEGVPPNFFWTIKSLHRKGVPKVDVSFLAGCDCQGSCTEDCNCIKENYADSIFPFDKERRLKNNKRLVIYECNSCCKCSPDCINRIVQKGCSLKLCILRFPKKGWGLVTREFIAKGSFVTNYIGEVITKHEAEERLGRYNRDQRTYLFDLDYFKPSGSCPFTCDAVFYGNESHFINHSCEPNLRVVPVIIDNPNPDLHLNAFFATRDIEPGEELLFDYLGLRGTDEVRKTDVGKRTGINDCKCYCGART
ncbi:SET domain-containing protein, partial [Rozella allomycis CSF55]